MAEGYPRALSERERELVNLLLRMDFPGADALRAQAQSVRVRGLWKDLPTVVLFEVTGDDAPRAEVLHTVPVEARVRNADPPRELLLFVKDGRLDSIELVDYGGTDAFELPAPADLEAVQTNFAGDERHKPHGGRL